MTLKRSLFRTIFRVRSSRNRTALVILALTWTAIFVIWSTNNNVDNMSNMYDIFDEIDKWHDSDKRAELPLKSRFKGYRQSQLHYWSYDDENYEEMVKNYENSFRFGQNGSATILSDEEEIRRDEKTKHLHQLSLVVSDKVDLNRSLPDVRPKSCRLVKYPDRLPDTSVIIVFHNEPLSTLLRTVHSVINRSPRQLLKEIILVDDASNQDDLITKLPQSLLTLAASTIILRSETRIGLIQARLKGAKAALGSVLIFLDSHIEVAPFWLPPLLTLISERRSTVALPIVDDIDADTFEYRGPESLQSGRVRGGIDWKFMHAWLAPIIDHDLIRDNDLISPNNDLIGDDNDSYYSQTFVTPTMIGCVIAVDRAFFFASGAFDEQMRIWGGENVEMSVRVWLCGGALIKTPCSHVGHLYRAATPHTLPGDLQTQKDTSLINTARFVEVWTDEYKSLFNFLNAHANSINLGNLDERFRLKEELKCHDFKWFLENVYIDHGFPNINEENEFFGQIKEIQSGLCLDAMGVRGPAVLRQCHGLGGFQNIIYRGGELRSSTRCLTAIGKENKLSFETCDFSESQQFLWTANSQIVHKSSKLCLTSNKLRMKTSKAEKKAKLLSFLANVVLDADNKNARAATEPRLKPCNTHLNNNNNDVNEGNYNGNHPISDSSSYVYQTWVKGNRAEWQKQ